MMIVLFSIICNLMLLTTLYSLYWLHKQAQLDIDDLIESMELSNRVGNVRLFESIYELKKVGN